MAEPLVVRREVQIAAPQAAVYAFLTDPEKNLSWIGTEAETEVEPGGIYLVKGVGGRANTARGAFREVVPIHRLAYSFGWEGSWEGSGEVPPGSSLIEIDLVARDGGTLLRLTHSGLPNAAQCASHDRGWAHYLGRLAMAAAGQNPGIDRGPEGETCPISAHRANSHTPIRPRDIPAACQARSGRKSARISAAKACGCSIAAK